ncbi:MAG: AsmA-like C-terminal region-containing protein [Blastocatellia bacterium]
MAKQRRWLPRLLVLVALLVVPLAIAPLLPLDSLKPAVESRLSASFGRKVTVGSMRLSFWGGPYLTIDGMKAKEDPAFGEGDFLKAGQVRADFAISDYVFRRQVVIDGITIKSPEFTFIKSGDGVWSWTTVGRRAPERVAVARPHALQAAHPLLTLLSALLVDLKDASFNNVHVEGASVRLIDETGEQPPESLYKNISLDAAITRPPGGAVSRAAGEVRAESDETDASEVLKADLPFDLNIDRGAAPALSVSGTLGPGPLQTKNFSAKTFKLDGKISASGDAPPEQAAPRRAVSNIIGNGHITSGEIFIPSVNISEQVARALNLDQVGDMSQGTGISSLETDFKIEQGVVNTSNLNIQQLDGLGDATADSGWFKIESALMLNYAATVLLSPEATAQVKKVSPLIGAAISVLESNNRVPVPVNITGDVRNPHVQVDVSRIF